MVHAGTVDAECQGLSMSNDTIAECLEQLSVAWRNLFRVLITSIEQDARLLAEKLGVVTPKAQKSEDYRKAEFICNCALIERMTSLKAAIDRWNKIQPTMFPVPMLTDSEVLELARTTPFSWQELDRAFGRQSQT